MMMVALVSMTQAMAMNSVDNTLDKGRDKMADKHRTHRMYRMNRHDGDITGMMVQKLGLDKKQAAKLKELNSEYSDLFQRPDRSGQMKRQEGVKRQEPTEAERAEMRQSFEKRKARQQEYDGKLKGILTTEQYAQYEQMKPKHGPGHHGKGGAGMRGMKGKAQASDCQCKCKE